MEETAINQENIELFCVFVLNFVINVMIFTETETETEIDWLPPTGNKPAI